MTMTPRRGLVLGAGGVLGAAWTIGALSALQELYDWDPRHAEVIVGTSAGSVLAASLGSGVGVQSLLNHQQGIVAPGDPQIDYDHQRDSGGALPPIPFPFLGSPRGLLSSALHPMRTAPMVRLSTVLPKGRGSLEPVGRLVDGLVPPGRWASHPRTWVVAVDYDSGRRTTFGSPGAPPAALRDAVQASCSIPGWYAPVRIGGRRYVDGGVCSATSLDLVTRLPVDQRLDEVVVLAPMAALDYDTPTTFSGRLERRLRRHVGRRLQVEVRKVEATGTRVTVLAPGRQDLQVIGANMMDPRRREQVLATSLLTSRAALRRTGLAATG